MPTKTAQKILDAAQRLSDAMDGLTFREPVTHVYNPLDYAWNSHEQYIHKYAKRSCKVLLLGMNPGPWGMAQTGVPFGEINAVRDWLKVKSDVGRPQHEHPKRPVEGFACQRSEVSGRRLWGLFASRFSKPSDFFRDHFVTNYCPLVFMEQSARNVTPDKLPRQERQAIEEHCDEHLSEILSVLRPSWAIGVGAWAEKCLGRVASEEVNLGKILHPSPASPAANKGWSEKATAQLEELGIW